MSVLGFIGAFLFEENYQGCPAGLSTVRKGYVKRADV